MIIIVGLGNPGKKFYHTRHNAGFEVLDFFAAQNTFPENEVLLVKPQTFMNESGKAVKEILRNKNEATLIVVRDDTDMDLGKIKLLKNKNAPTLVVVHDDIDLPLGKIKFSKDSSSGGHKGVDSIIQALGTKDFARLKIGIATGDHKAGEVVLQKFSPQEQEILNEVTKKSAEALTYFIENGLEKTMNEYNR